MKSKTPLTDTIKKVRYELAKADIKDAIVETEILATICGCKIIVRVPITMPPNVQSSGTRDQMT